MHASQPEKPVSQLREKVKSDRWLWLVAVGGFCVSSWIAFMLLSTNDLIEFPPNIPRRTSIELLIPGGLITLSLLFWPIALITSVIAAVKAASKKDLQDVTTALTQPYKLIVAGLVVIIPFALWAEMSLDVWLRQGSGGLKTIVPLLPLLCSGLLFFTNAIGAVMLIFTGAAVGAFFRLLFRSSRTAAVITTLVIMLICLLVMLMAIDTAMVTECGPTTHPNTILHAGTRRIIGAGFLGPLVVWLILKGIIALIMRFRTNTL